MGICSCGLSQFKGQLIAYMQTYNKYTNIALAKFVKDFTER